MSPPESPPGITISESPSGDIHPIAGAPTSIAAFIGWAMQGPTDAAVLVRSWSDFERQFGGFDPRFYLGYAVSHFFANGGQGAYVVRLASGDSGGSTATRGAVMTGAHLLDAVPIFNLLAVPGEADPDTIAQLQAYCAGRRAFLIVDSAPGSTFATLQAGPDSLMTGANAINSALYFPWLNALDPQQNITRPFPPSGFVAGLYAATDASRGIWHAPAGASASLTGQSGPALDLTDSEAATLNAHAVNCVRHLAQIGTVVWGGRILGGSDQVASEWKYVPVRRLALYIESSLSDGIKWAAFEPNNERLWAELRSSIGSFMQTLFLQGAFQGTTPAQAYFVKCDAQNNPQSGIDQGVVNIVVGFAPLKPAEFVVIQIQRVTGQAGS
jgi:phage tail sheath protein FI